MALKLDTILTSVNVAEELKEEDLTEIGDDVHSGYEADSESRRDYDESLKLWTKLALQVFEKKTYPWKDASNVKYPLLSTAAMQFAARAYPSLIPSSGHIVKCRVLGADPDGQKKERADRVSKFMSYQILDEMEEWEEEMDKLLITVPIAGTVFKKTYWDSERERNVSSVVMPKDLIVNYWAKDLESAERITEVYKLSKRKYEEKKRQKLFLDVELGDPVIAIEVNTQEDPHKMSAPSSDDETTPYIILEQHRFLDLDDDGYPEPYVVTVEENSKKVLRIVARFSTEDVIVDEKSDIVKIIPQQYYTKFGFVPNPDGGFYDIGFGQLLGSINASADTLINQLIDAGSLSNLQSGFISKGLRPKMGESMFSPGEWKAVNATGQDLKQGIFPLPLREPSKVLMELLTFLIQSGKELASVAEIFVGKMPGQNTPATTTMATIEQGMKVFTAVYKRMFRSLTREFRKLYRLNKTYLNPQTEAEFLDAPMEQSDFQGPDNDIIPAADPASISQQEKQVKVQAVMQLMPMGVINPMAFAQYYLEAFEVPNVEGLLMQPQPQVDPEQQRMEQEAQIEQQMAQMKMQGESQKQQVKEAESQAKLKAEREKSDIKIRNEAILGDLKVQNAMMQGAQKSSQADASHRQKMMMQQEKHRAAVQQSKEKAAQKPKRG
jgi:chaperonin GroES